MQCAVVVDLAALCGFKGVPDGEPRLTDAIAAAARRIRRGRRDP